MNAPVQAHHAKIGFANWENRVAPVFDTARQLYLVEIDSACIVSQKHETLPDEQPFQRALRLVEWNVSILVCGAISREMEGLLIGYGIKVVSFIAGDLQEVVDAWVHDTLGGARFSMPGCCGGRRRARRRQRRCQAADIDTNGGRRRDRAKRR